MPESSRTKAPTAPSAILVVDDEPALLRFLELMLAGEGYAVTACASGAAALAAFDPARTDLVLHDLMMPGLGGLELLDELTRRDPDVVAIVMTAFATWATAVEAMRKGAHGYVKKPFDTDEVKALVARAVECRRLKRSGDAEVARAGHGLVGDSPALRELLAKIKRVAATDSTILVRGESGTGKELVARTIHQRSARRDQAMLSINCAALPDALLESELFGHKKGAFSGAIADKPGLFALADGGTLFLDEVGELSPEVQAKLLRALESREFMPVGGTASRKVDLRFVAATNRDLGAAVAAGRFREDLYYRLAVIPLELPPLRARKDDIPLLVGHFLARYNQRWGRGVERIDEDALAALAAHDWPGNVRGLDNCIQRAVALCEGGRITLADLPFKAVPPAPSGPASIALPPGGLDLEALLLATERGLIEAALARTGGHLTNAAPLLGMTFRQLRYRVRKLGIRG